MHNKMRSWLINAILTIIVVFIGIYGLLLYSYYSLGGLLTTPANVSSEQKQAFEEFTSIATKQPLKGVVDGCWTTALEGEADLLLSINLTKSLTTVRLIDYLPANPFTYIASAESKLQGSYLSFRNIRGKNSLISELGWVIGISPKSAETLYIVSVQQQIEMKRIKCGQQFMSNVN